jgi:hypothetical protein
VFRRLGNSQLQGASVLTRRVSKASVVEAALARHHERAKKRRQSPYRRAIIGAIDVLGPSAYVSMIVRHLASTDPPVKTTSGAVHATLRRMEAAGYLISRSAPSPIPDARHVIAYEVTPVGRAAYGGR